MVDTTRDRIVTEALRLFAVRGYAGTSIGSIEEAAGLSPGSGSLYTHFDSKEAVLAAAVDRAVDLAETGFEIAPMLPLGDLRSELTLMARGSLLLLGTWGDLIRVMLKESDQFPAVMADARARLFDGSYRFFADWLAAKSKSGELPDADHEAIAIVALGSIEAYWVMCNVYDNRPFGVDDDRFVEQWVTSLLRALGAR